MFEHKPAVAAILLVLLSLNCLAQDAYRHSLDGTWAFKTDLYNRGEAGGWFRPDVDTSDWDEMAVPGNWDLENEYADYAGKAWYRKTVDVPDAWKGKAIRLVFESVYNDVQVWLNGKQIGEHHAGFLPFWLDIRQSVEYGEPNTLVLQVDNTFKRGAVWNWGGIRRPVWLEITDEVRLERQHVTAIPDLESGTAEIAIEFEVSNAANSTQAFTYDLVILREGKPVWTSPASTRAKALEIGSGDRLQKTVTFRLPESKVDLWHFNFPNLYTSRLRIYQDDQQIHQLEDRFGIRKVEIDGYDFKLNGESIRTVGFNLVPEDRVTGNTLPLWRIKEDVDLMKSLGANMARLSHLPLPEEFLDYLDESGIMIFEEVSLWGKDAMVDPDHPAPKYWLEKMIEVKYNHPSIIGWSVGNEIGYLHKNPKVMAYVDGAIQRARELDPNRLAVYVSNSAAKQETDPVRYSELIMFNAYGDWGKKVLAVNKLHPEKPVFVSEYGSSLNSENPDLAHIEAAKILDQLRDRPYVMGASLWTFNDYRSFWKAGPTWTTPPSQNRAWGVVDTFRRKKRPFEIFKAEYAPVKSFDVAVSEAGEPEANITVGPRGELDIPAYAMNGYKVVWHIDDREGKVIDGGLVNLPEMNPGGETWQQRVRWEKTSRNAASLEVDLLDPQNYSVRDERIYFVPPPAPEIVKVHTSINRARVIFNKVPTATAYKLVYGKGQESGLTINDFIEVGDLERSASYDFQVIALNNAGESAPSSVVRASTDEDELPPVIWNTAAFEDSFFIGYSVDRLDYLYDIRYGTAPGEYTRQISLRNVGVCQVPGLKPGETYYFQMRSRKQWGFASEWTHEIKVKLRDVNPRRDVEILGVIGNDNSSLVYFEPVERAIGYEVSYKQKGSADWQRKQADSAVLNYIEITGLRADKAYDFRMKSIFE